MEEKEKRKRGRPKKKKAGRPKLFPEKPKPPLLRMAFGRRCCVNSCTNTCSWSMMMYTLPEENELRERWLEFINRPNWSPDNQSLVCQVHFEPKMWKAKRSGDRDELRPAAVPTLLQGDEKSEDHNFIDDELEFEESDIIIKSEILEPEIDVSEEPGTVLEPFQTYFCDPAYNNNQENETIPKKRRYLENLKKDPVRYAEFRAKERARAKRRREYLQAHPELLEKDRIQQNRSKLNHHRRKKKMKLGTYEEKVSQFPFEIKLESFYPTEEEFALPDLNVPPINEEEMMEYVESEGREDSSDDPLVADLITDKGYKCPLCMKLLARKMSLRYHLERTHPNEELAQKLVFDLKTKLKYRKRELVLKDWCKTLPQLGPGISVPTVTISPDDRAVTSDSTLALPAPINLAATPEQSPSSRGGSILKQVLLFIKKEPLQENTEETMQTQETVPHLIPNSDVKPQLKIEAKSQVTSEMGPKNQVLNASDTDTQSAVPSDPKVLSKINRSYDFKIRDASSYMFCASLVGLPLETRMALKKKLMELVNAVITRQLDPERVIIAYTK